MEKGHPEIKYGKTGILLINLGTPNSTSWWDIRKYLKEFLSDRRVIELNPVLWQIILNLFILTFRPSKTAHAYKKIWRKDTNESPLLYFTRSQAQKLNNPKIVFSLPTLSAAGSRTPKFEFDKTGEIMTTVLKIEGFRRLPCQYAARTLD